MAIFFDSCLLDLVTTLCIIAGLIYYYLTSTYNFWQTLNIPYIKPEIFYGNMKDVMHFKRHQSEIFSDFYHHFKDSGHRYGGLFQMRDPTLLICSAELAKDIFVKNFPHFHDRNFAHDEHFDPLSANLICLEGQKWKFIRSKLSPAFSTSKLKVIFLTMEKITNEYLKVLGEAADKETMVEMRHSLSRFSMDVISSVAFGLEIDALHKDSKFLEMGRKFFEPSKFERLSQLIQNCFPWFYKTFKVRSISKDITEFFMGVLRDTMDYRRKNNIDRNDFLHFLMKINEEKGVSLNEMEEMKGVKDYNTSVNENSIELTEGVIAAQAFVFFLAGYETSASAMSFCFYELACHPEFQDRILEEVDLVLQKHGGITYESLQDMVYTEQIIEETLRVYPPVALLIRKCTKPYQIPDTKTVLPEGCQVFIPIRSFHSDPEYFPNPMEFKPERFSPENRKHLHPYAFMPFGHGPRVCIGARLAMMEMKMTLALAIKNFRICKCEKTKPPVLNPQSFFVVPLDGIWLRFVRREKV